MLVRVAPCAQMETCARNGLGRGLLRTRLGSQNRKTDYGNFEVVITSERLRLRSLVVALPHSNARFMIASMSQRAECMRTGLTAIFEWIGRSPRERVLSNATEIGRRIRREATKSHLFSLFRAHYHIASCYCNPNKCAGILTASPCRYCVSYAKRDADAPLDAFEIREIGREELMLKSEIQDIERARPSPVWVSARAEKRRCAHFERLTPSMPVAAALDNYHLFAPCSSGSSHRLTFSRTSLGETLKLSRCLTTWSGSRQESMTRTHRAMTRFSS